MSSGVIRASLSKHIKKGRRPQVRRILDALRSSELSIDIMNEALMIAVEYRRVDIARDLIIRGANQPRGPLIKAVKEEQWEMVLALLFGEIEAFDLNFVLLTASNAGQEAVAIRAIEKGATDLTLALNHAIKHGHYDLVKRFYAFF